MNAVCADRGQSNVPMKKEPTAKVREEHNTFAKSEQQKRWGMESRGGSKRPFLLPHKHIHTPYIQHFTVNVKKKKKNPESKTLAGQFTERA